MSHDPLLSHPLSPEDEAKVSAFIARFHTSPDDDRLSADFVHKLMDDYVKAEIRNIELIRLVNNSPGVLLAFSKGVMVALFRLYLEADANLFFGCDFLDLSPFQRKTIVEGRLKLLSKLFLEFAEKGKDFQP